ncbi:ABC transporter permease [Paenibacillus thalictri]|uniref:ABC transporter permease n=1 Tax=Paenibacillus thalictri TaxID=2527873 RepID=A0A4Q9DNQ8_9BACL|nr:ABC transporter permease [Paenibacillus thalictri]TBL76539.1 ABC transporter permease [Paenibacillus thalictri]
MAAKLSRLRKALLSEYLVLYLCIVYFVGFMFINPIFATGDNLFNIFTSMLPLLVIAVGQTVVLITGGIDLSVTSIVALCSIVGGSLITSDGGALSGSPLATPLAIMITILLAAVIGWFNGFAVTQIKMPPFIVTLTLMMILSGIAIWYTRSLPVYNLPKSFTMLGKGSFYSIPNAAFIVGGAMLVIHFMLSKTLFGSWIYAIGRNAKTSEISGIQVNKMIIFVYVLSAICGAIGAILLTGRLETGSPVMAKGMFLDVVGAAVIGGTSLFGGKGKVLWTLFGVLFITLIDNSLNLMGFSYFTIMMIKGAIILGAALVDSLRGKLSAA